MVAGTTEGELHRSSLEEKGRETLTHSSGDFLLRLACNVVSLVTLQFRRPCDTKDSDVILAVGQNSLTLLSAWTDYSVLLGAFWDKGLAQEAVDVCRAAQAHQGHEGLWMEGKVM